jgi:hypothetical protein
MTKADSVEPVQMDALSRVENICRKFHLIASQLQARHANRATLNIVDEYDVQDLMHSLLTIYFNDIRKEEGTQSHAGKSSKMDFLLKDESTVVETKMTRNGLGDKELGEELSLDIEWYKAHRDCKTLICFVYDPEKRLKNPISIEKDLSGKRDKLVVKVIVAPKGY